MIGHYVNNLSPEAEDRVLTMKLGYAPSYINGDCQCLVGAAADMCREKGILVCAEREMMIRAFLPSRNVIHNVGARYDRLVVRFGERLNIAVRNRILANRARRALSAARTPAVLEEVTA